MSDEHGGPVDDLQAIETLLAELDAEDLRLGSPPPDVWRGIERALGGGPATVIPINARRRWMRRIVPAAAAAAAVVVIAVAAAVIGTRGGSDAPVSSAALVHDPVAFDRRGADASATAELVRRDGGYVIRLNEAMLPTLGDEADLELWLIEPDAAGNPVDVAPVAILDADGDGTYAVPERLDPRSHYVVDISVEPRDGDPAHSGQSILRGALEPS